MKTKRFSTRVVLLAGVAVIGLTGLNFSSNTADNSTFSVSMLTPAFAQQAGGNPGKGKQQKGSTGQGQGQTGAGGVPKGSSASTTSEDGDDGDEAKGPKYEGGGDHGNMDSGVRPPWAQEGVPSVELGRLNVAKAPEHVITRALDEIYLNNLDKNEDGTLDDDADLSIIDSPIANLGLLQEALSGERQVDGSWTLLDAATFLGKASDKYIPVNTDTVIAISTILGFPDYDFSTFSYNRASTYTDDFSKVFDSEAYVGTGLEAFAQAADDARAVIVYYHDL